MSGIPVPFPFSAAQRPTAVIDAFGSPRSDGCPRRSTQSEIETTVIDMKDARTTPTTRRENPMHRARRRTTHSLTALLAAASVTLCAWTPAHAADLPATATTPAAAPRDGAPWEFQLTVYGWLTSLDGDIGIRRLPTASVNASFGDLISHLDGVLPVSFLAKKDDWTLLFDLYWAHLGADGTLPTAALPHLDVSFRQTIASAVFGYRLPVGGPDFDLSATAGFRYQRLSVNSTLSVLALPLTLSETDTKDWLDPVFGLMLQYRLNPKWFINALADVGGFGLGSKLTSQGFFSVGYNWTPSWTTALGYRALYTDYQSFSSPSSDFRYRTTIHGPFLSVAYHF